MNSFYKKIMQSIIKILKNLKSYTVKKILIILSNILILKSRKFYNTYTLLEDAELKFFSQNGEDGIIDFLVKKLNLKKPSFVEIGIGDYSEANTRFLYEMYYGKGLVVDINKDLKKKVLSNVSLWRGNLNILEKSVSSENINEILSDNAKFEIDVFSIDIDGVDYWILNEIKPKIAKIIVLEYNSIFGSELEVTISNIKNFNRTNAHYSNLYYGASLKSYIKLMNKKGYYFLGVNRLRNNAFFISNDFSKNEFFPNIIEYSFADFTNSLVRESRSEKGLLDYLSKKNRKNLIKDCYIIDLSNNKEEKKKLRDLSNE